MYGAQISLGLLVPFLISWIFIGNFTLLNLLMAILLDGFDSDDVTEDMNILEAEFEVQPNLEFDAAKEQDPNAMLNQNNNALS